MELVRGLITQHLDLQYNLLHRGSDKRQGFPREIVSLGFPKVIVELKTS